jgi:AcrR family transcriptional regulator
MVLTERPTVQQTILAACERALARHGYRRMTMEDVCEEAHLARRTLYLHFPNKEALVNATILEMIARTQAAMSEPLQGGTGLDSLRGMLIGRILIRLKYVGPYHHSIDDINRELYPHSSEEDQAFYEPEVISVMAALEKGTSDGSISVTDSRLVAELLIRATNGFLPSNLTPAEVADVGLVRSKLETFVNIVSQGIAARHGL